LKKHPNSDVPAVRLRTAHRALHGVSKSTQKTLLHVFKTSSVSPPKAERSVVQAGPGHLQSQIHEDGSPWPNELSVSPKLAAFPFLLLTF
jgi:hypothetical protein